MTITIIYAHPYDKSFNHAIFEKKIAKLKSDSKVNIIDLYKDGFDPTYSERELSLFKNGETSDTQVSEYQKMIKESTKLIFVFPIWWNDLPAMLKGFVDKVFKMNFSYVDTPRGVKGKLNNIQSAEIITTSKSPTWYIKLFAGNAIRNVFIKATLKQVGIKHVSWKNFGQISKSQSKERGDFLNDL